jgi:hypothetical protein
MQSKKQIANELLKLDYFEARAKRAIQSIREWARWQQDKPDPQLEEWREKRIKRAIENPRMRGAGSEYLVLNAQGRSVYATNQRDLAEGMADNRIGSKLLDLNELSSYRRRVITNALRSNVGRTKAIVPPVPPAPAPKQSTPADPNQKLIEMLSEVRRRVLELAKEGHWDHTKQRKVMQAAGEMAITAGFEVTTDWLFEIGLLDYRDVYDYLTGEVTHFDSADEASAWSWNQNQSPDGMLRNDKGQALHYRYKVQKTGE